MKKLLILPMVVLASQANAADFTKEILPIFKASCYSCHSNEKKKVKADLALDDVKSMGEAIGANKVVIPGDAEKSPFFKSITSHVEDDGHMPPKKTLADEQIALIKAWINDGAKFPGLDGEEGDSMMGMAGSSAPQPGRTPAPAAAAAPQLTTWTSADGRSIQATFLRLAPDQTKVTLRRQDGQVFEIPLERLSPESKALALGGGIPQ